MTPLLNVNSVVAYRGDCPLFEPATFDIERGQCIRITGANGSGKTTLLDCIAGLYSDWTGTIQKPKRHVSYFQQTPSYVRTLSLKSAAELVTGFDSDRYHELVERLCLRTVEESLIAVLSGGELQRARLLLAILRRHSLLLLDEPFANIDPSSRDAIADELERTKDARATVVVTHSHDSRGILQEHTEYALCTLPQ